MRGRPQEGKSHTPGPWESLSQPWKDAEPKTGDMGGDLGKQQNNQPNKELWEF